MRKAKGTKLGAPDKAPKLRGVAASSRGHSYGVDVRTQAFNYRKGLQASLLRLRLRTNADSVEEELSRFDMLSAFEANRFKRQPIGFDYLSFLTTPKDIPLHQELVWLGRRLARQTAAIRKFVAQKLSVEDHIFFDRPQEALEVIEALESEEGVSLWSMTITVSILQWFYGTEAQKTFVASIRQLNKIGMLPYIVNYVSQLCEETVTLSWYRQSLKRRLTGREVTDITIYMESKLAAVWPLDDEGIATRLRIEQNHHDYDVYEALVGALQALTSRITLDTELVDAAISACNSLIDIPDLRLAKLKLRLQQAPIPVSDAAECQSMDQLLRGRLGAAMKAAVSALRSAPNSIYDAIACAGAELGLAKTRAQITFSVTRAVVTGLMPVLARDDDKLVRHDQLEKFCVMFSGLAYAAALQEFIRAERISDPDHYLPGLCAFATASPSASLIDAVLMGQRNLDPRSPVVSAVDGMRIGGGDALEGLSPDVASFVRSFRSAVSGDGEGGAISLTLLNSQNRWIRSHASLVALRSCALRGDVDGAAKIISAEVCIHGTSPEMLPIDDVFRGLEWKALASDASTIYFLNAFHMYAEQSSDDKAPTHRRFALTKFLASMGVTLPSELRSFVGSFEGEELRFFLGKVCNQQTIDMLRALRSSAEVLEERRAICSVILNTTRDRVSEYEEEIVSISKDLAVQHGLRAYDGSRVHVDRAGLKKVLRQRLSESYARYTALVESGVGVGEDFDELLRDLVRNEGGSKYLLSIPENEADELLRAIMSEVRDGFLLNIPHGLDSYLSKRVRHGSIVGHIRGAVEQEKVILQRNATQRYAPDGRLTNGLPQSEADQVNAAMVSFSKLFDSYLLRLKDVVLHVRTADRPLGLFDLSYNVAAVHMIRSAYKTDATFDGLLDSVLAVYWSLMAPSLAQAQHLFRVEASKVLTEQLHGFRQRVQEVVADSGERARIGAAISRAITGVQAKLETAAGWFDPAHLEPREYTAEEAVSIGVASVRAIHFGFDPQVQITTGQSSTINMTYLPVFVDVLFIIFGNIAENSHCGPTPMCSVNISQDSANGVLSVRVENQVALRESFDACVSKMDHRKAQITAGELSARVRQEGDSGLAKLASITTQSARGSLNFGYRDEQTFFVELELSLVGEESPEPTEDV